MERAHAVRRAGALRAGYPLGDGGLKSTPGRAWRDQRTPPNMDTEKGRSRGSPRLGLVGALDTSYARPDAVAGAKSRTP